MARCEALISYRKSAVKTKIEYVSSVKAVMDVDEAPKARSATVPAIATINKRINLMGELGDMPVMPALRRTIFCLTSRYVPTFLLATGIEASVQLI